MSRKRGIMSLHVAISLQRGAERIGYKLWTLRISGQACRKLRNLSSAYAMPFFRNSPMAFAIVTDRASVRSPKFEISLLPSRQRARCYGVILRVFPPKGSTSIIAYSVFQPSRTDATVYHKRYYLGLCLQETGDDAQTIVSWRNAKM